MIINERCKLSTQLPIHVPLGWLHECVAKHIGMEYAAHEKIPINVFRLTWDEYSQRLVFTMEALVARYLKALVDVAPGGLPKRSAGEVWLSSEGEQQGFLGSLYFLLKDSHFGWSLMIGRFLCFQFLVLWMPLCFQFCPVGFDHLVTSIMNSSYPLISCILSCECQVRDSIQMNSNSKRSIRRNLSMSSTRQRGAEMLIMLLSAVFWRSAKSSQEALRHLIGPAPTSLDQLRTEGITSDLWKRFSNTSNHHGTTVSASFSLQELSWMLWPIWKRVLSCLNNLAISLYHWHPLTILGHSKFSWGNAPLKIQNPIWDLLRFDQRLPFPFRQTKGALLAVHIATWDGFEKGFPHRRNLLS